MTSEQRRSLMAYWWPAACRAQGWDKNDRNLRLKVLSTAVNRPISSASDLNNASDIDAVKAHLLALTDNLKAAVETDDPTIGEARRLRHIITAEIIPCLGVYEENPVGYLQTVLIGLTRWYKTDEPERAPTLYDLDAKPTHSRRPPNYVLKEGPSQLEQAMMTLNARLHEKRRSAGHSIHDMKLAAGLPCNCRLCANQRRTMQPANCPF